MTIRKFRAGRVSTVTASDWVGEPGTMFYDEATGQLKIADGVTPGGSYIPLVIATSTTAGAVKAGPGANVAVDGTLTIDTAGLPLSFGNLTVNDTTLKTVATNADLILESSGTGNVSLVGNVFFHPTNGPTLTTPYFQASSDGQLTILVPASDPEAGAVKIIGSTTGRVSPPINTGVMLQLTGNNDDPSRLYNDAIGAFAAFVGRRINGNLSYPTAVRAGDEMIRISATGHNGTNVSGGGAGRIVYQAIETFTPSATGSNISIWTCAVGSNTLSKIVTVDSASGLTATRATIQGNLTVSGNIVGNAVTTTATINTANVATLNVSGNATVSGYFTGKWIRTVRNAGTIADGGTLTIDFSTDAIVYCVWGNGMTLAYQNYTAGRVVRLIATKSSGTGTDTLNLDGVTATHTSTGTTTVSAAADTTVFVEFTCTNTTLDSVYVKL